jgi:hypothetical protein
LGGIKTRHKKKRQVCYDVQHSASDLDGFFGTTQETESEHGKLEVSADQLIENTRSEFLKRI